VSPVTVNDLVAGLLRLGVKPGEVLLCHSSLSSFGHVEGGAETVIRALIEVVGEEGTVAIPTFSYSFPPERPPWDRATSPSQVGRVTEVFRSWPGVLRTDQPSHSVSACGPEAAFITRAYGNFRPYDKLGPFGKMYRLGTRVLFLGCGTSPNSTLHACEDWAEMPYLGPTEVHVREADGSVRRFALQKMPVGHRDFYRGREWRKAKVNQRLAERGLLTEVTIGQAEVVSIGTQQLVDACMDIFAGEPDLLLCDDPGCEFCVRGKALLSHWHLPPWDHLESVRFSE
jgi:aminoglycoside 3-N-acetyltransferase